MLSKRVDRTDSEVVPTYARRGLSRSISRWEIPHDGMAPDDAYRLIHDQLALDGNPELNLATFVTTWMDDQADRLMAESANKNAIDWDEYPETVEIQDRCVNILSRLYHAPTAADGAEAVGTATVGSSEAIHLAGLAMKWRWRKNREAAGLDLDRPNIVMGSNVQVCWEKFARYFDVEPRYVPLSADRWILDVEGAVAQVDERTIGVVGILGSTYTGEYEPIGALAAALDGVEAEKGWDIPVHVDAASGGFVAPFLQPDLTWDFRLDRVHSINVSGHKYGLVYPGVGWVLWRSQADLPHELIFTVDYLGGSHDNFGLNFSRGAAQIIAQYYNFIRLGWNGYREVMVSLQSTAKWLAGGIEGLGCFDILASGDDLPVVCFAVRSGETFDVFELSDQLRLHGWIVPAYKMAANATTLAVLRVVVREGLSADMAEHLLEDIEAAIGRCRASRGVTASIPPRPTAAPHHRKARTTIGKPAAPQTRAIC